MRRVILFSRSCFLHEKLLVEAIPKYTEILNGNFQSEKNEGIYLLYDMITGARPRGSSDQNSA